MSDRPRRGDGKKGKPNVDAMRAAMEKGLSGLDALEDEVIEDVYDLKDEDEYAALVEQRRAANDFVVEDNGLGYYDDGEEILGVGEDAHEAKRRLKEQADGGDDKMAKKARKLGDAAGQKGTMERFVRPVTGAPKERLQGGAKETAPLTAMLDIDHLMGGGGGKSGGGGGGGGSASSQMRPGAGAMPVMIPRRPIAHRPMAPHRSSQAAMEVDDYDAYGGSFDDAAPYETEGGMDQQDEAAAGGGASSSSGGGVKSETEVQRMAISKTTRKIKVSTDPVRNSAGEIIFDSGTYKPALGEGGSDATMGMGEIGSGTSLSQDSSAALNPLFWLNRSEAVLDANGAVTTPASEYVNMFWIDASEANGVIYLFGKVHVNDPSIPATSPKQFVSCCLAVHGSERNLFVLPRATGGFKVDNTPVRAGMLEVYNDLNALLVPHIIPRTNGGSFKVKPVRRNYAFEHGEVPREETEYMKVVYSSKFGTPSPAQCADGKNIERIFGAQATCLELFLLKRKLKGPCWITIKNPRTMPDRVSWCNLEIGVENPKFVSVSKQSDVSPPLVSMSISLKTAVNPVTHVHEVVVISGLVHTRVDMDADTDMRPTDMRRFTYVRQLGLSCGPAFPNQFPNDLPRMVERFGGGVLETFPNERAMLSKFFTRLQIDDPDLLSSHNLFGFEFDVILSRAVTQKVPNWDRIGRLRRSRPPKSINDRDSVAGRILCDTYKAAKEFLRETTYSLTHLAESQLSVKRVDVDPVDVPRFFSNSQDVIKIANHTSCDCMLVQRLMFKLQVVPLTKALTNLSGNLWSRTLRGARAERIEYLLLHSFYAQKYVLPERKPFENKKGRVSGNEEEEEENGGGLGNNKVGGKGRTRAKAAYAGGLVLEPKKGLYDSYILLLDFNSLYPSLIQEYNLCFTTVNWTKFMGETPAQIAASAAAKAAEAAAEAAGGSGGGGGKSKKSKKSKKAASSSSSSSSETIDDEELLDDEEEDEAEEVLGANALPPIPDATLSTGILPTVIKMLVDRRKAVKSLLKTERDPAKRANLDIRQKAYKLTANSMYGCLGFSFSRFYARPIAALVTSKGREALQRTVDKATREMGLDVIYGDTDSVMINTGSTDLAAVRLIGKQVVTEVNKLYKSLELDIDGVFKSMLLLKKKKYAALSIKEDSSGDITYEKELKGLDLVRRDWCPLSKDAGKYVVDQILSGNPREEIVMAIHDYLTDLATKVRTPGGMDLSVFVVTKGLNKNPKDYPDCKGQAHLQVALEMLKNNRPVNIGDHIPYVICMQGPEGAMAPQRARHPDDVFRSNGELTLDVEWYLSNQILPPISRLCEPIEGTSAAILSAKLGLDASKYAKATASDELGEDGWGFTPKCQMDDAERFKDCIKLKCKCKSCSVEVVFPGPFSEQTGHSGLNCGNCGAIYMGRNNAGDCYSFLSNRVTMLVRECVKQYYDCWLCCDDSSCKRRTMQQSVMGYACTDDCHGRMVQDFDEAQLHAQLKYLESLFDFNRSMVKRQQAAEGGGAGGAGAVANSSSASAASVQAYAASHGIPREHVEVFALLKQHMSNTVSGSAYNWIRPSLWSTVFGKSTATSSK